VLVLVDVGDVAAVCGGLVEIFFIPLFFEFIRQLAERGGGEPASDAPTSHGGKVTAP
jgi:hypothetical protein